VQADYVQASWCRPYVLNGKGETDPDLCYSIVRQFQGDNAAKPNAPANPPTTGAAMLAKLRWDADFVTSSACTTFTNTHAHLH